MRCRVLDMTQPPEPGLKVPYSDNIQGLICMACACRPDKTPLWVACCAVQNRRVHIVPTSCANLMPYLMPVNVEISGIWHAGWVVCLVDLFCMPRLFVLHANLPSVYAMLITLICCTKVHFVLPTSFQLIRPHNCYAGGHWRQLWRVAGPDTDQVAPEQRR